MQKYLIYLCLVRERPDKHRNCYVQHNYFKEIIDNKHGTCYCIYFMSV